MPLTITTESPLLPAKGYGSSMASEVWGDCFSLGHFLSLSITKIEPEKQTRKGEVGTPKVMPEENVALSGEI